MSTRQTPAAPAGTANLKFRFGAACKRSASDGALHRYEILARKFAGVEKSAFLKTERGDVVRWENLNLLGDGKTKRAESAVRETGFD